MGGLVAFWILFGLIFTIVGIQQMVERREYGSLGEDWIFALAAMTGLLLAPLWAAAAFIGFAVMVVRWILLGLSEACRTLVGR